MFMLISHGSRHLQLASVDGHRFLFRIHQDGPARQVEIGDIEWTRGLAPADSSNLLAHASHFATCCAQDYGLL